MRKVHEMSGCRFGEWAVLFRDLSKASGSKLSIYWVCRCSCGRIDSVHATTLRLGRSTRCVDCRAKGQRRGQLGVFRGLFKSTLREAGRRGIEFNITEDDACSKLVAQGYRCALTHREIGFANTAKEHRRGGTTASIDRIDPSIGYEPGNIQWVDKWVNLSKNDLTQDEFVAMCRDVTENTTRKNSRAQQAEQDS